MLLLVDSPWPFVGSRTNQAIREGETQQKQSSFPEEAWWRSFLFRVTVLLQGEWHSFLTQKSSMATFTNRLSSTATAKQQRKATQNSKDASDPPQKAAKQRQEIS